MVYTVVFTDTKFMYRQANGNSREAEKKFYWAMYPCRRHPTHTMFPRLFQWFRKIGQFKTQYHDRGGRWTLQTPDKEESMLDHSTGEPSISSWSVVHEMDVTYSRPTVWKVIREQQLHPLPPTESACFDSCWLCTSCLFTEWLLHCSMVDPHFSAYVLSTDEAFFTRDRMLNRQNSHAWVNE